MNIDEARQLQPGDRVMCVDLRACALEDNRELHVWEVAHVADFAGVRVRMLHGEHKQLVSYQNIAYKVGTL